MDNASFYHQELWGSDDTYSNFRIPGMLVTKEGTLLTYCEARRTSSDWAIMDILMQRSTDRGKTFSDYFPLAQGTEVHNTVNNPVMLQDKNGRIHFLYCEDYTINGGRILRRYSDDDGLTWSPCVDITSFAMPDYHNAFALGPGHGIVTADGTLLIPIWMVPKFYKAPLSSHTPSFISTLYSLDNGETWALGEILETNREVISPNETVAAVTSQGQIYLNIRHMGFCRAKAYSDTGYSRWTDYGPDYQLPDPHCFGSVAAYHDGKHPYSLIFGNCASKTGRNHVTVYASTDDGKTFPVSKLLDETRGGYVEVATDSKNGLVYVLYEESYGKKDYLAVFTYDWLTN